MKRRRFLHPQEELKGLPVPLSEVDDSPKRERLWSVLRLRADDQKTLLVLTVALLVGVVLWLWGNETAMTLIRPEKMSSGRTLDFLVDLNHAPKSEIRQLPGVGEILADRILEYREQVGAFEHATDLENIRGIGAKKRENAASYVYIAANKNPE